MINLKRLRDIRNGYKASANKITNSMQQVMKRKGEQHTAEGNNNEIMKLNFLFLSVTRKNKTVLLLLASNCIYLYVRHI